MDTTTLYLPKVIVIAAPHLTQINLLLIEICVRQDKNIFLTQVYTPLVDINLEFVDYKNYETLKIANCKENILEAAKIQTFLPIAVMNI